ncbi:BrnT family toxin [Desulfobacterales bacterium HSG2]|nr:BrnT family toxin [Desulfobacterales bacterium HSG2]
MNNAERGNPVPPPVMRAGQPQGMLSEGRTGMPKEANALSKYDEEHSEDEERWILPGKSLSEAVLVVVHTFADDDGTEFVRIISARRATKREKQAYHKRCQT